MDSLRHVREEVFRLPPAVRPFMFMYLASLVVVPILVVAALTVLHGTARTGALVWAGLAGLAYAVFRVGARNRKR